MKVNDELRMTNDEGSSKSEPAPFRISDFGIHSSFAIRHSSLTKSHGRSGGSVFAFSLIECLVYIALFFIVLSVALGAYFRMDEQSRGFARNSADIVRAMQAGERWRADVRSATNAARFDADQELRLKTRGGEVNYYFRDGTVWRQGTNEPHAVPLLLNVMVTV